MIFSQHSKAHLLKFKKRANMSSCLLRSHATVLPINKRMHQEPEYSRLFFYFPGNSFILQRCPLSSSNASYQSFPEIITFLITPLIQRNFSRSIRAPSSDSFSHRRFSAMLRQELQAVFNEGYLN